MAFSTTAAISLGAATVYPDVKQTVTCTVSVAGGSDAITVTAVRPYLTNPTCPVCFGLVLPGGPNAGTLLSGGQAIAAAGSYAFTFDMVIGGVAANSLTVGCQITCLDTADGTVHVINATTASLTVSDMVALLGL